MTVLKRLVFCTLLGGLGDDLLLADSPRPIPPPAAAIRADEPKPATFEVVPVTALPNNVRVAFAKNSDHQHDVVYRRQVGGERASFVKHFSTNGMNRRLFLRVDADGNALCKLTISRTDVLNRGEKPEPLADDKRLELESAESDLLSSDVELDRLPQAVREAVTKTLDAGVRRGLYCERRGKAVQYVLNDEFKGAYRETRFDEHGKVQAQREIPAQRAQQSSGR